MTTHVIHDTPRRSHDDLHAAKRVDLLPDLLSAVNRKHLDPVHIFCNLPKLLCRLDGKLSRRAENDALQLFQLRIDPLQRRDTECRRLSRSRLRLSDHILAAKQTGNRLFLNRRKFLKAHFPHCLENALIYHIFPAFRLNIFRFFQDVLTALFCFFPYLVSVLILHDFFPFHQTIFVCIRKLPTRAILRQTIQVSRILHFFSGS